MLDVNGFSPYQLVFGRNPRLPSVDKNELPALEEAVSTQSECLSRFLTNIQQSIREFLAIDSSQRISRALLHNVRKDDGPFSIGDDVYYKRQETRWRGPARIIGIDGRIYLLRHGGQIIKVHPHFLRRVRCEVSVESTPPCSAVEQNTMCEKKRELESSDEDENLEKSSGNDSTEEQKHSKIEVQESRDEFPNADDALVQTSSTIGRDDLTVKRALPKRGDRIRFTLQDPGQFDNDFAGVILGRAGKVRGKNQNWMNLQYDYPESIAGTCASLDFSEHVTSWQPENDSCLITALGKSAFFDEMALELENWKENDVYEVVPDRGQSLISCRWVLTEKPNGQRKARLVARGFEDPDQDTVVKESPTCAKDSLRIVISLCATLVWQCGSIDIKAAFLQGSNVLRYIYLEPPAENNSQGFVWKLKKSVYGLVDAPRMWYRKVCAEVLHLGGVVSLFDPAVFYWHDNEEPMGFVCLHVDDFWWTGNENFRRTVISGFEKVFTVGSVSSVPRNYLGLCIDSAMSGYSVSQQAFHETLCEMPLTHSKDEKTRPTTPEEKKELRGIIGKLLWLSVQTRPEISCSLSQLSSNLKESNVSDILAANKLIRYVRSEEVTLKFPELGLINDCRFVVFTDASLANNKDGSTQAGYLVFLTNIKTGDCSLISWRSQKLKRIVRSTLSAETLACVDGVDAAFLMQNLMKELTTSLLPIFVITDNVSLVEAVYSPKSVRDKRLRVDLGYLKNLIEEKCVKKLIWVPSQYQLADCLTKPKNDIRNSLRHCLKTWNFGVINRYLKAAE